MRIFRFLIFLVALQLNCASSGELATGKSVSKENVVISILGGKSTSTYLGFRNIEFRADPRVSSYDTIEISFQNRSSHPLTIALLPTEGLLGNGEKIKLLYANYCCSISELASQSFNDYKGFAPYKDIVLLPGEVEKRRLIFEVERGKRIEGLRFFQLDQTSQKYLEWLEVKL